MFLMHLGQFDIRSAEHPDLFILAFFHNTQWRSTCHSRGNIQFISQTQRMHVAISSPARFFFGFKKKKSQKFQYLPQEESKIQVPGMVQFPYTTINKQINKYNFLKKQTNFSLETQERSKQANTWESKQEKQHSLLALFITTIQ